MRDYVQIGGTASDIQELEGFCREQNIHTERGTPNFCNEITITITNDTVIVIFLASIFLTPIIKPWLKRCNKALRLFIPEKGWLSIDSETSDDKANTLLSESSTILVEDKKEELPK